MIDVALILFRLEARELYGPGIDTANDEAQGLAGIATLEDIGRFPAWRDPDAETLRQGIPQEGLMLVRRTAEGGDSAGGEFDLGHGGLLSM